MTKSKTTKRALLVSALSMLLCLAMLVGTTFAWFTDTVTTGKNTIIAGNLDVELYARDESGNYKTVGENDSLFDNDALWEPGHTEVAYLKVENKGTLALKYKLSVTVDSESETSGINVNGETFKLSDYLVFGQITATEDITAYATREEAQEAAGSTMGLGNYTPQESTLSSGEVAYVALIVYMPTTVGNEANYRIAEDQEDQTDIPTIELGVSLVATQTTYEKDGFGDDYDEYVPSTVVSTADELTSAIANGEDVVLSEDISVSSALSVTEDVAIDLNGNTLSYTNSTSWINVEGSGANLTITGGNLEANSMEQSNIAVISGYGGSSVTLDNVTFNTNGVALAPYGDATEVNVINSTITAGGYAITTNAGTEENYGVVINVTNSTLTTDNSTVLVNIPCTLNMTDTTVYGAFHGVVVRGGTAVLTNCTIINKITTETDFTGYFDNSNWGTGNTLTLGALVFGNKSGSYQYATSVTLINTTVTADNSAYTDGRDYPAIYGYGNSGEGIGATLTYDSDCVINGTIISGNEYATINGQSNFNSSSSN